MERHIVYLELERLKNLAEKAGLTIEDLNVMLYLCLSQQDRDIITRHFEQVAKALR